MPLLFQTMIKRDDLRRNPSALYLFGDNEARAGYGGQAKEMRGELNAVGIRTKRAPSNAPASFWVEGNGRGQSPPSRFIAMIEADYSPVRDALGLGSIVIVPAAGLGTGLSRLDELAPVTFRHLEKIISNAAQGWHHLIPPPPD